MLERHRHRLGPLALLLATLIWGSSFVVMKSTLEEVPAYFLLALRFTIGTVTLLLIGVRQLKKLNREYLFHGLIMGIFLALAYISQTQGLRLTSPGKNAFLTSVYCIIVPFLFWLVKKQRPDRFNILAALICFLGIGMISMNSELQIQTGDLLTLLGGFFYACHILAIASASRCEKMLLVTMIQFAVAALICWCCFGIFEKLPESIGFSAWGSIIYLGLMPTTVSLLLQSVGQKHTHPASASVILTLDSVFGAALSIILGKDDLTLRLVMGFVLIFGAIVISETKLEFLKKKNS